MPKIAEIELTPNPNARKFVLKEPLTWGIQRSYENAEMAQHDPLAKTLFAIPHVTNVFYLDNWVTVTQDGQADWQELLKQLAEPIREATAEEQTGQFDVSREEASIETDPEDQERIDKINALLDEQVRPYLMGDGGNLQILGLRDDQLYIHYQGACGSCPSSLAGTLSAIQRLVHTVEPELEIVAV